MSYDSPVPYWDTVDKMTGRPIRSELLGDNCNGETQRKQEQAEDTQSIGFRGAYEREKKYEEDSERAARIEQNMAKSMGEAKARTANLLQKSQALSEKTIDTDRWWNSRSTGQKLAGGLASILSGALNPHGENATIKLMNQYIDRDIQAQMGDLNRQRGLLKDQTVPATIPLIPFRR